MGRGLQYLTVRLPEDIEKLKWYGDFERAKRVIDMRLEKEIPEEAPGAGKMDLEEAAPYLYLYQRAGSGQDAGGFKGCYRGGAGQAPG